MKTKPIIANLKEKINVMPINKTNMYIFEHNFVTVKLKEAEIQEEYKFGNN